jgi:AcrR family transcriptional regulator
MAGTSGPRGPYAKTEARRADILRTALEAFSVHGFQGSSLREIAEAVGLSQAGVLHHFSSKEALLAAVLAQKDAESIAHFTGATGLGILAGLRGVVVHNLAQPGLIRLFTTLSAEALNPEHPAHAFFQERYHVARSMLAAALAHGQREGTVATDLDTVQAAALVLAAMDGLQLQWLLHEEFDLLGAFDLFLTGFREQLSPL